MPDVIQTNLRAIFTVLLGMVLITLSSNGLLGEEKHTKDSLETIKKKMAAKKALLVDVRESSEWKEGHLVRALFLPLSELEDGLKGKKLEERISKKMIIYTHCASGYRSVTAADILKKQGYDVRPLKAGYRDLVAAGFKKAEK